jgi:hypothetical protein
MISCGWRDIIPYAEEAHRLPGNPQGFLNLAGFLTGPMTGINNEGGKYSAKKRPYFKKRRIA